MRARRARRSACAAPCLLRPQSLPGTALHWLRDIVLSLARRTPSACRCQCLRCPHPPLHPPPGVRAVNGARYVTAAARGHIDATSGRSSPPLHYIDSTIAARFARGRLVSCSGRSTPSHPSLHSLLLTTLRRARLDRLLPRAER